VSALVLLGLIAALACGVAWACLGRTAWWVPAFSFSFIGGHVDVGFKIFPHEIGMALSVAACAVLMATTPRRVAGRPRLDWSVYVLVAYMLGHLAVADYLALAAGLSGTGTIVRAYVNGLWALVLVMLFWRHGDLRHFRTALILATIFCLVDIAFGVVAIYSPGVLAGRWTGILVVAGGVDLRTWAPALATLLVLWFYRRQGALTKGAIVAAYAGAIYLAFLGGSRVAALSALVAPLLWAMVQRKGIGLLVASAAAASLLLGINYSADVYDRLPDGVRRSLSTFVMTRAVREHHDTADSDWWHSTLLERGFTRWTASATSFALGNTVDALAEGDEKPRSLDQLANVSARLSYYENALSTITATLGIVGLLLFVRVSYWLYRPFTPHLLRNGIHSGHDALAFVAVQSLVIYVALCWVVGSYPSSQMVFGVLAAASFADRKSGRHAQGDLLIADSDRPSRVRRFRPSVIGHARAARISPEISRR
jgi:hypothetical protein